MGFRILRLQSCLSCRVFTAHPAVLTPRNKQAGYDLCFDQSGQGKYHAVILKINAKSRFKETLIKSERSRLCSECSDSRRESHVIASYCERLHDCRDAGGSAPTVGALGDAWSNCRDATRKLDILSARYKCMT